MPSRSNGLWFRVYTDITRNPKLTKMSDSDQLLFLKCLALHKEAQLLGTPAEDIAYMLHMPKGKVAAGLARLKERGLLLENLMPKGWSERQFESDSSTERSRQLRAKQKEALPSNVACNSIATQLGQTSNVACTVASNVACNIIATTPIRDRAETEQRESRLALWKRLTEQPEMRGLTFEMFLKVVADYDVDLTEALVEELRGRALLMGELANPGMWFRAQMSRLELETIAEKKAAPPRCEVPFVRLADRYAKEVAGGN